MDNDLWVCTQRDTFEQDQQFAAYYEQMGAYAEHVVAHGRSCAEHLFPHVVDHLKTCRACTYEVEDTILFLLKEEVSFVFSLMQKKLDVLQIRVLTRTSLHRNSYYTLLCPHTCGVVFLITIGL